jgi:hypothetical protein
VRDARELLASGAKAPEIEQTLCAEGLTPEVAHQAVLDAVAGPLDDMRAEERRDQVAKRWRAYLACVGSVACFAVLAAIATSPEELGIAPGWSLRKWLFPPFAVGCGLLVYAVKQFLGVDADLSEEIRERRGH